MKELPIEKTRYLEPLGRLRRGWPLSCELSDSVYVNERTRAMMSVRGGREWGGGAKSWSRSLGLLGRGIARGPRFCGLSSPRSFFSVREPAVAWTTMTRARRG